MCDFLKKLIRVKNETISEKTSQPIGESNLAPYTTKVSAKSTKGQIIWDVSYDSPAPLTKIRIRFFENDIDITNRLEDVSWVSNRGLFRLCAYVFRDPQTSKYYCVQDYDSTRLETQVNRTLTYRTFVADNQGFLDGSASYAMEAEITANTTMSWSVRS